jgi:Capsule assembly protein Wzi
VSRPVACCILLLSVSAPAVLSAQTIGTVGGRSEVFAGGELENYLRYLQTLGVVPLYPWGARAFSPVELDRLFPTDTAHPWVRRYDLVAKPGDHHSFTWLAPTASLRANTTFPYGFNDGPIWAGRGLTFAGQAGFAARVGSLSLTVAPEVLVTQNAAFSLMSNGQSGRLAYADGLNTSIDRPQRFGNSAFARLDPGQTTLRLDWHAVSFGSTTANQYWGPASEFPIMLGNNAPGFLQVFLGTARPVDLWLLRIHGRLVWGRLSQSAFSPETAAAGVRFGTGIVLVLSPRGVPGLELGFTRFSHQPWPQRFTLSDLLHMLHGREGAAPGGNVTTDNQLATAFFRWVLPHSGFEVYGEYGRDDYNQNLRDFIQEPDHIGGYTIGFRKVTRRPGGRLLAVRAEVQNLQFSRLAQGRGWAPFYTHSRVQQGHTQLGQVLGSEAGVGGAGSVVAVESYSARGRWTWSLTRLQWQQRGDPSGAGPPDPRGVDVQHALAGERLWFRGRYDLLLRATAVYELNRSFTHDAFNLNLIVGTRVALSPRARRGMDSDGARR